MLSIKEKKELLTKATANGKLYYTCTIPNLKQKDDDSFKTVSNPCRIDRKASLSVYRNKDYNKWLYNDFGDSNYHGDMFDFAAKRYGMDIKTQFADIMDKMWGDLELDKIEPGVLEKLATGWDGTNNVFYSGIKIPIAKYSSTQSYKKDDEKEEEPLLFYNEIPENELTLLEKEFLDKTGIDISIMKEYGAHFINHYSEVYENPARTKRRNKPNSIVWIVYDFKKYYKIYQPNPKRFWYVGKKSRVQNFGTSQIERQFEILTPVYLTAGEKDALVLLSKGYKAMCLNSETQSVSTEMYNGWRNHNRYDIIVAYDNDATGTAQANKLHIELGVKYIVWPNWLKEKGGKDVTDFFALGGSKEEFESLCVIKPNEVNQDCRLSVRTALQRLRDAEGCPDIISHADVLFQSNELTILFGDTGKGKSIFAVGLADAISKGTSFMCLENKCEPLIVLFYDFELSDKQFQKRYSNANGVFYHFNDKLFIDNFDLSSIDLSNKKVVFEEELMKKIRLDLHATGAKVLIIDNITFLTAFSTEDGQVAMKLMRLLKELKTTEGISVLVLAHTPKRFGLGGITSTDIAGSKHLSNFADSVMALGASKKDTNIRYIIQTKASRTGEVKYDAENIILCEIEKEDSFLTLSFKGYGKEQEHLVPMNNDTQEEMKKKAIELKEMGKSYQMIADELGTSKSTVGRWFAPPVTTKL